LPKPKDAAELELNSNIMTETLAALGRRLENRSLLSEELVRHYLARIAHENDKLHAFSNVFDEEALADARCLDDERRRGIVRGTLHGLPIAVKDLADIKGRVTGFGSRAYGSEPARETACFVERLKEAGLIIIGTTHMVEFAFGSWGTNHTVGTPWNPIDRVTHRVPGGSSSGSAVAVAAGLIPGAIGSDTGGSIRIPASLCGIVGFKPTIGRVSTKGVAPLSPTFDTIGPLVNSVHDARLILAALTETEVPSVTTDVAQMRIGIVERSQLEPLDPHVARLFDDAVTRLRTTVEHCESVRLPMAPAEYQRRTGEIMAFEAYQRLRRIVDDEASPLDPFVRQRARAGREVSEIRYHEALAERQQAIREFSPVFARYDIIVLPTTPLPAVPLTEVDESTFPMSRFTRIGNYLDLCGISVPLRPLDGGLPVGLQILAGTGRDADLLAFGEHVAKVAAGD
jgi:aspartyl-tRNA(Asn)/glutamyl-tRNA(Gln) amidotransferase subunit A